MSLISISYNPPYSTEELLINGVEIGCLIIGETDTGNIVYEFTIIDQIGSTGNTVQEELNTFIGGLSNFTDLQTEIDSITVDDKQAYSVKFSFTL